MLLLCGRLARGSHLSNGIGLPGDCAVTRMNMGWELPGTFNASIQIRNIGLRAVSMFFET